MEGEEEVCALKTCDGEVGGSPVSYGVSSRKLLASSATDGKQRLATVLTWTETQITLTCASHAYWLSSL